MYKFFRYLVLFVLIASLPLQGLAAAMLPCARLQPGITSASVSVNIKPKTPAIQQSLPHKHHASCHAQGSNMKCNLCSACMIGQDVNSNTFQVFPVIASTSEAIIYLPAYFYHLTPQPLQRPPVAAST